MIAGEDHRLLADLLAPDLLFFDLQMDESGQDVEPRIPLPDFFPEVRRLVAVGIGRIPGPRSSPRLNGRKKVLLPSSSVVIQTSSGIDGEVDECPLLELEDLVPRIAIGHVLVPGVNDGLAGERVFQFGRGHRNAVQAQHQIERLGRLPLAVVQLPSDGQAVGAVQPLRCPGSSRGPVRSRPRRSACRST